MQLFAGLKLKHEGETGLVLNPRIPIGNGSPLFDRCNAFHTRFIDGLKAKPPALSPRWRARIQPNIRVALAT